MSIQDDLDDIRCGGMAFPGHATRIYQSEREERVVEYPGVQGEWTPPKPLTKRQKNKLSQVTPFKERKKPERRKPLKVPGRHPDCTARQALSSHYAVAFEQAEQRLTSGWRQGQCTICKLWKWGDEPCEIAEFKVKPRVRL